MMKKSKDRKFAQWHNLASVTKIHLEFESMKKNTSKCTDSQNQLTMMKVVYIKYR